MSGESLEFFNNDFSINNLYVKILLIKQEYVGGIVRVL